MLKIKQRVMTKRLDLCAGLRVEKRREKGRRTKLGEATSWTNGVSAQTNESLPLEHQADACDYSVR